jgi:hypothetical protein
MVWPSNLSARIPAGSVRLAVGAGKRKISPGCPAISWIASASWESSRFFLAASHDSALPDGVIDAPFDRRAVQQRLKPTEYIPEPLI